MTRKNIMNKAIFNNQINLEYPDGFTQLSDEENSKYFMGNQLRQSFHNKEKHVLLSLSKSKDSFLYRFLSLEGVLNSSLSNLANNLKDYQTLEKHESTIFNQESLTACFSFVAKDKDVKQYGELSIFKMKKAIYAIYCVCWFTDKEENKIIFKQFKDSLHE